VWFSFSSCAESHEAMKSRKHVHGKKWEAVRDFLNEKVDQYNRPGFIENDPVSIPHGFRRKQDIEIAGLFAAVLAWGQRVTIINKCRQLMEMMDNDPHNFILHHREKDLRPLIDFKHRTFNGTDTLYFVLLCARRRDGRAGVEPVPGALL
jgi:hypothetical protein